MTTLRILLAVAIVNSAISPCYSNADYPIKVSSEFMAPMGYQMELMKLAPTDINPFQSCENALTKDAQHIQLSGTPGDALAFLQEVHASLLDGSEQQLDTINNMIRCLDKGENCTPKVKRQITSLNRRFSENLKQMRLYMALMDISSCRFLTPAEPPIDFDYQTSLEQIKAGGLRVLRFANQIEHTLKAASVEPLTSDEIRAALEIYNEDVREFMTGASDMLARYDKATNGLNLPLSLSEQFQRRKVRDRFFQRNWTQMRQFYLQKYAQVVASNPVLVYYQGARPPSEGNYKMLLGALRVVAANAREFYDRKLTMSARNWRDLQAHILMLESADEALKKSPQFCTTANRLWKTVSAEKKDNDTRKSVGLFALFTLCGVASFMTDGVIAPFCATIGLTTGFSLLVMEEIDLGLKTRELFRKLQSSEGNSAKVLELRVRYIAQQVRWVQFAFSAMIASGKFPGLHSKISGYLGDMLRQHSGDLEAILVERIAAHLVYSAQDKMINAFIRATIRAQKSAKELRNIDRYHLFLRKFPTT